MRMPRADSPNRATRNCWPEDAVDAGSRSAGEAQAGLAAGRNPAWGDRLWEIWADKRQSWLGEVLQQGQVPFAGEQPALRVLSRLKLGGADLGADEATAKAVGRWVTDTDVQAGMTRYLATLDATVGRRWAESLPLSREVALAVAGLAGGPASPAAAVALAYGERVFAAGADFSAAFALRAGLGERLPTRRATVIEVLGLRADGDEALQSAARDWLSALPNDQQLNDVLVDDWLRTDDEFLSNLLRDQRRWSSEGGKEALLLLLWGDAKGYQALGDTDGRLLSEAWAMANDARRERMATVIQATRDAALADQLLRAQVLVSGGDKALGWQALLATGDEDRIVAAARDLKGRDLFDLVRRWAENGRRPKDPRKRAAVERAVTALKNLPKVEVEPAPKLPEGLDDPLEGWSAHQASDTELQGELRAPDPLVRARALFALSQRGKVGEEELRAKAASEDWPERFVAALRGPHPDASNDHVYWVSACAGEDSGTHEALVACGPDEFQRAQERLAKLRSRGTPLAKRDAAELDALQAFRELDKSDISVKADDSAPEPGGIKTHGDVDADVLKAMVGKGGGAPRGRSQR